MATVSELRQFAGLLLNAASQSRQNMDLLFEMQLQRPPKSHPPRLHLCSNCITFSRLASHPQIDKYLFLMHVIRFNSKVATSAFIRAIAAFTSAGLERRR